MVVDLHGEHASVDLFFERPLVPRRRKRMMDALFQHFDEDGEDAPIQRQREFFGAGVIVTARENATDHVRMIRRPNFRRVNIRLMCGQDELLQPLHHLGRGVPNVEFDEGAARLLVQIRADADAA